MIQGMLGWLAGWLLGLASPAGWTHPQMETVGCPASFDLARLVASSHLIVAGSIPIGARGPIMAAPSQSYISIPLEVEHIIKGSAPSILTVRHYSEDRTYSPSLKQLADSSGSLSLSFLVQVDEAGPQLFFAGSTPDAFRPTSEIALAAVRAEVARQERILSTWRPDPRRPHFDEVVELVSRLGRADRVEQRLIFQRLEKLGTPAVPAIIAVMDDRRPLNDPHISLVNRAADAFEGMRHYGPALVVDGLEAILNQITGRSFGAIHNGGSERERQATVAGWRVYAADLDCPTGGPAG
ncbi:hypothetical protein [Sphingomonas sp. M1-B02]|uniref:hypothetical protein n=1 Tax=Sphingomonas sp. M1-B02 TaxID=3114300 RepID=UPI00223EE99D|nr:hypothetical protein [Sphingomonas sp. S6-11]UZK64938.1 hypothetical protein OKW87_10440 [Sphingomonas sp. S6-11]